MAEPTLRDVLNAVAAIAKDLTAYRAETAARFESLERNGAEHRRETAEHRRETREGFAALDRELESHADPIHRELEKKVDKLAKDVAALKAARPRAARPARRG